MILFSYIYSICNSQNDLKDLLRNPESKLQTNALMPQKEVEHSIWTERNPEQDWVGDLSAPFNYPLQEAGQERRGEREGITFTNLNSKGKKLNNKHTPPH